MIAKWNNNKTLDEVDVIVEDNETIDIVNTFEDETINI